MTELDTSFNDLLTTDPCDFKVSLGSKVNGLLTADCDILCKLEDE